MARPARPLCDFVRAVSIRAPLAVALLALALAPAGARADAVSLRGPGGTFDRSVRGFAAATPQPLTGVGKNMRLVANVPMEPGRDGVVSSDLELAGRYAYVGAYGEGLVIVDVSDPRHPRRVGRLDCGGGSQYDVQLSPDARYAVLSTDDPGATCVPPGQQGSIVIDVSDPAHPMQVAFIPISVGTHTQTLDWPILYINNYPADYHRLEVYDLSTPWAPVKRSELDFGAGQTSVHDLSVDHRPDGRVLAYAAAVRTTDVIDVTDPGRPALLQAISDPSVAFSHQAEPDFSRSLLLVTDEFAAGAPTAACGAPQAGGALHFYRLARDGTISQNGADVAGTYDIPYQENPSGGCSVHVFWQAPDQDRLVTAWYGRGVRVLDFSDPAHVRELGWFIPAGANTFAAKAHDGYVFTGDIARGMDVLRYTGEGGRGWPATAGPAEGERARVQGNFRGWTTSRPPGAAGGYRFARRVRVPGPRGRRVTLTVTIFAGRAMVAKLRFPARRGHLARLRARMTGVPGTYRYVVRSGGRGTVLRRGSFTISAATAPEFSLPPGQVLVCRIA